MIMALTIVVGVTSVNAMSESELQAKLTKAYTINGVTYQATTAEKNQIARYLAKNEVKSSDADYISQKVDELVAAIQASGTKEESFDKMPKSVKDKMKTIAADITANTEIKVVIQKDAIVIYNTDNTQFGEVSALVKQTDNTVSIIASIALIVTVIGSFMVVRQAKSQTVTYA